MDEAYAIISLGDKLNDSILFKEQNEMPRSWFLRGISIPLEQVA